MITYAAAGIVTVAAVMVTGNITAGHETHEAGSPGSPARLRAAGVHEQCQHLTDRPLSADGFWQGQMGLDAVAIAAAVLVLDDVAGFGEVGDDAEGAALGDAQRRGDVTQAHPGVV